MEPTEWLDLDEAAIWDASSRFAAPVASESQ
jgi:hypothetical protein